jgi:peroxidase
MEFRSIDGTGNNLGDPELNAAGDASTRIAPARFADGVSQMVGGPNPRTVSNVVVGEGEAATPNGQGLSGMMYAWGQFIDHDLTRSPSDGVTNISVTVPTGDPDFPDGTTILVTRAVTDPASGTGPDNPVQPVNAVTAWLDASMVYGSSAATAASLRGADGRMLTSQGDNLPIVNGMFAAGDVRAAENPALTALQTLFVREHNWQVDRLAAEDPTLTGDELYEMARAIVSAEIAHITYSEFLPALLGPGAIPDYDGYDASIDPRLSVEFSGAAYRWGHSTVSAETERKDEFGALIGEGLELRDAFFMPPAAFAADGGADGFLRHLSTDLAQAMDARIVDDLRNFLLDAGVGQDLAAVNIQRGRDFGLATLNGTRMALGLTPYTEFEQITDDAATVEALRTAYGGNVDAIDLWTGGLSEKLASGTFLGETFGLIVARQFTALRDGDRLWYENQGFDAGSLAAIEATSLSDIIRRNTDTLFLQDDVFIFHERRDAASPAEHPELPQLIVGNGDGETLAGGSADDLLVGRGGSDLLTGGAGSDTADYSSSPTGVSVSLLIGRGWGGDAQGDVLVGIENVTGSAHDDSLTGAQGPNILAGGAGNDAYIVDEWDAVIEEAGAGTDTVYTTAHARLAANVENLVLQGSDDLQAYGNGLGNVLVGNAGRNILDGDTDIDAMFGGAGDDVYFVDNAGDVVVENTGEGTDLVFSTAHLRLSTNVEHLILQGGADLQGYGNSLVNLIFGNSGNNIVNGDAGADAMFGGAGNDVYFIDDAGDMAIENANEGSDVVFSTAHVRLSANLEILVLQGGADLQGYGNAGANTLYGNAGNNLLDGDAGVDLMVGGAGNDTYFADDAGDLVFEGLNEGSDAVFAMVNAILPANVEALVLRGSGNLSGTGNTLANQLYGNAGDNRLDGGAEADLLTGGAGNDTFVFEAGQADGDIIVDFDGNGPAAGDSLQFVGYSADATLTRNDATHWQITYDGGASQEIITFMNGASVDDSDVLFV